MFVKKSHKMRDLINDEKLEEYYLNIFSVIKHTGRFEIDKLKNPEEKAKAVKSVYWNVKGLDVNSAIKLEQCGCLNVGICPMCGSYPIGKNESWPYSWGWFSGPNLYLCKECYTTGYALTNGPRRLRKIFAVILFIISIYLIYLCLFGHGWWWGIVALITIIIFLSIARKIKYQILE